MVKRNESKIECAKEIILNSFYFLEDKYYYAPVFRIEESNIFIESLDVEYTNEIRRRKINISFTKGKLGDNTKYTFTVSITRTPYTGVEDFFSMSNYLQSLGKDFNTSIINDFDKSEADIIVKKIAEALKEHASKIIEGAIWLETFYPRRD
jgi:hypothetical protein